MKLKSIFLNILIVTSGALLFWSGVEFGKLMECYSFQSELIEIGFGEYNSKTGKWQYKVNHTILVDEAVEKDTYDLEKPNNLFDEMIKENKYILEELPLPMKSTPKQKSKQK